MLSISAGSVTVPVCTPYRDCPPPALRLSGYHPSYFSEPLPLPPRTTNSTPEWNTLDWPVTGATRYARAHLLLDGPSWVSLGNPTNVTLTFDDGDGPVSVACVVVSAVPVSDSRGAPSGGTTGVDEVLYEVLVSDLRYNANRPVTTAAAPSTWGDLISRLYNIATGNTISASTINAKINAAYGTPPATFAYTETLGRSAAAVLDAACAAVNLRVVFAPDGVQWFQNAADGVAFPYASDLHMGGFVTLERAATLNVTSYGATHATSTVSVSGGVGTTEVWLPYTGSGVTRFGVDYASWQTGDVPDGWFVGFKTLPLNARLDRWIIRHDAGITGFVRSLAGWPFPLVGSRPAAASGGANLNTQNTDGTEVDSTTTDLRFNKTTGVQVTQSGGISTVTNIAASPTQQGVVTTGTQEFAGVKGLRDKLVVTAGGLSGTNPATVPFTQVVQGGLSAASVDSAWGVTCLGFAGTGSRQVLTAYNANSRVSTGDPNYTQAATVQLSFIGWNQTAGVSYAAYTSSIARPTVGSQVYLTVGATGNYHGISFIGPSWGTTPAGVVPDMYRDESEFSAGVYGPIRHDINLLANAGVTHGGRRGGVDKLGIDTNYTVRAGDVLEFVAGHLISVTPAPPPSPPSPPVIPPVSPPPP